MRSFFFVFFSYLPKAALKRYSKLEGVEVEGEDIGKGMGKSKSERWSVGRKSLGALSVCLESLGVRIQLGCHARSHDWCYGLVVIHVAEAYT